MNEYENPILHTPQRTEDVILGLIAWGTDLDGTMTIGSQEFEYDD